MYEYARRDEKFPHADGEQDRKTVRKWSKRTLDGFAERLSRFGFAVRKFRKGLLASYSRAVPRFEAPMNHVATDGDLA
ncbi:hypothetical protein [Halodesulfurarchaeum formicicum]|uniref:Uncharacterized protein n=1 Tax=Halodesulfurarchaeum formicicum TaxID=1873524 RepID=A0A1J1ACB3_9EURY|nr:hypothetical protein [Halodesulfurarchaeum formicicum]APE95408.1 hypothetical protein HSR6_0955 [Halodesulfurarchaeum formicicum]